MWCNACMLCMWPIDIIGDKKMYQDEKQKKIRRTLFVLTMVLLFNVVIKKKESFFLSISCVRSYYLLIFFLNELELIPRFDFIFSYSEYLS